jgi:hypothetical protein
VGIRTKFTAGPVFRSVLWRRLSKALKKSPQLKEPADVGGWTKELAVIDWEPSPNHSVAFLGFRSWPVLGGYLVLVSL